MTIRERFPLNVLTAGIVICGLTMLVGSITLPLPLPLSLAPAAHAAEAAKPAPAKTGTPTKLDPAHARNMAAGLAIFKSDVRQLLLDHCVKCHGGEKLKGEFDLTTREKLIEGGFEDAGIVPGDHRKSWSWKLINHDAKPPMPHKQPKLPDAAIAKIGKWIDLGAPYDKPLVDKGDEPKVREFRITEEDRQFWSFKPLQRVEPKAQPGDRWSRTMIDRFIVAKLREKQLTPAATATRRTLIRRAYADLIGLPPTPAQIDAFENDKDPNAFAKVIDQLLASEHYGERWARHWLDVARFGESHGFEQDYDRKHAYHFRDFVIKAMNADMPFNQFVSWQLAGDEMAPDNPLAMMATGFLGAGVFPTQLTEKEFESARYDELDDMAGTMGTAMLGLTIGCARCHDHKFDPISNSDYYRILSSFATTIRSEIQLNLASPQEQQKAKQAHEQKLKALQAEISKFEKDQLPGLFAKYVEEHGKQISTKATAWQVLNIDSHRTANGTRFEKQPDGSLLKVGNVPNTDTYTFTAKVKGQSISALRIEALTHASFPRKGPGLAANGNFCLADLTVVAQPTSSAKKVPAVKIASTRVTHEQNKSSLGANASFDGDKDKTGWAVDAGGIGKDQAALFIFDKPINATAETVLTITMRFTHPNNKHAMGRPRLSVTASDPNTVAIQGEGQGIPTEIARVIQQLAHGENQPENVKADAMKWYATTLPQWQKLNNALAKHKSTGPAQTKKATVMVASEGFKPMKHHADGRGFPHFYKQVYMLKRGDPNQKVKPVTQSFLSVLMRDGKNESAWTTAPPKGARTSYRRTGLAHWITDTKQGAGHLLARVIVNRLWHHHFGRGIVASPNDFGFQGERPTHPLLLDWLATELIRNNWKLKPIHKLIMTSAVYMQNANNASHNEQIDPENRFFWRQSLRRLEAEVIRDSMLHVSGLLDTRMYGAGTLDQRMKRRSIYFFIKRSKLVPVMQLFDMPEPLTSHGARPATTVAPQALMFLNSPIVRDYAVAFAKQVQDESVDVTIKNAYRRAIGREPTAAELKDNRQYILDDIATYREQKKPNPIQLATANFCQVLFCLNEFVYID